MARELLKKSGLEVECAANGAQAVELAAQQDFAAILMDLHMPEMDGLEATRRIRASTSGARLPIIAMTAAASDEDRQACADAGMDAHLGKPIDLRQLQHTLARWLPVKAATPDPEHPSPPDSPATLDHAGALQRLGGNQALYRQLLQDFRQRHQHTATHIQSLLQQQDNTALYQLAHDLKGHAGNLGLTAIQHAAATLCERSRSQTDHPQALADAAALLAESCQQALAQLSDYNENLVEAHATHSGAEVDWLALQPALDELRQLLQHNNLRARRSAEAIAGQLAQTPRAAQFAPVWQATQELNFKEALTRLTQMTNDCLPDAS